MSGCPISTYAQFPAAKYPLDEGSVYGGVCYRLLNDVLIKKLASKIAEVWLRKFCMAQSII